LGAVREGEDYKKLGLLRKDLEDDLKIQAVEDPISYLKDFRDAKRQVRVNAFNKYIQNKNEFLQVYPEEEAMKKAKSVFESQYKQDMEKLKLRFRDEDVKTATKASKQTSRNI